MRLDGALSAFRPQSGARVLVNGIGLGAEPRGLDGSKTCQMAGRACRPPVQDLGCEVGVAREWEWKWKRELCCDEEERSLVSCLCTVTVLTVLDRSWLIHSTARRAVIDLQESGERSHSSLLAAENSQRQLGNSLPQVVLIRHARRCTSSRCGHSETWQDAIPLHRRRARLVMARSGTSGRSTGSWRTLPSCTNECHLSDDTT